MIKIQEHINRVDAESYLDSLADSLWSFFNPMLANGKGLKKNTLINRCINFRNKTTEPNYLEKYAQEDTSIANRHRLLFDYFLASNYAELKRIIVARPSEFSQIIGNINNILHPTDLFTGVPGNYSQTPFGLLLSDTIFNYTDFRSSSYCKQLFSDIGFASVTCPYCNDIRLNIIEITNHSTQQTKKTAYLDLDHFYPKSQHPYFTTSFFNLIPTCHNCNAVDKRDKSFTIETHIHPYYEAFDDFYKFKISLTSLLGDPVDSIEIVKSPIKPLDVTVVDLNLLPRYNTHLERAQYLVNYFIKHKHNMGTANEGCFIEAIMDLHGGSPIVRKDILKCQLGKMNRDLLRQIDIHNVLNIM